MDKESLTLNIFLVIFLGGLGGLFRFALAQKFDKKSFPYGTLLANLLAVFTLIICRIYFKTNSPIFNALVIPSFATSLSTFSSFALQIDNFLEEKNYKKATLYCLISLFGGLAICFFLLLIFSEVGR